jgi:hypothetical protein
MLGSSNQFLQGLNFSFESGVASLGGGSGALTISVVLGVQPTKSNRKKLSCKMFLTFIVITFRLIKKVMQNTKKLRSLFGSEAFLV